MALVLNLHKPHHHRRRLNHRRYKLQACTEQSPHCIAVVTGRTQFLSSELHQSEGKVPMLPPCHSTITNFRAGTKRHRVSTTEHPSLAYLFSGDRMPIPTWKLATCPINFDEHCRLQIPWEIPDKAHAASVDTVQ